MHLRLALLLVALSATVVAPAAAVTYEDAPGSPYPSEGRLAWALALADLDGDGHLDFATTEDEAGSLAIRFGAGDGTFGPLVRASVAPAARPLAIAAADLDGDGVDDLAATVARGPCASCAGGVDSGIVVLLSRPGRAFEAARFIQAPAQTALATGDYDSDGDVDLVVQRQDAARAVTLMLNDGDGRFGVGTRHTIAGGEPLGLVSGDIDADGALDVVALRWYANGLAVLRGDGRGGLLAAAEVPVSGHLPRYPAVGDFDGDGTPDLAVGYEQSVHVETFLNDGHGAFAGTDLFSFASSRAHVAAADVDLDGYDDIAVAAQDGAKLHVLLSRGDGTFDEPRAFPTGGNSFDVRLGDVDEDGAPDAVVLERGLGVRVLLRTSGRDRTELVAKPVVDLTGVGLAGRLSLASTGAGVAGATLAFAVNGRPVCTATTDADGRGRCDAPGPLVRAIRRQGYAVEFAGDAGRLPSSAHGDLVDAPGDSG